MKVLLVNKYHYLKGGAERCYFDTANLLKEAGHEVAFFSMKDKKNIKTKWSKYFIDNIDYNNMSGFGRKVILAFSLLYNFSAKKKMKKLIKDFKPDIAHIHNIYHHISPSIIDVLKKHNIPMVLTLHDYRLICPNYNLFVRDHIWEKSKHGKYYKCFLDKCFKNSYHMSFLTSLESYLHNTILKTYEKVDIFISPSNFLINKFKEFGFKKDIKYLPNPVLQTFENIKESREKDYILYFGRLSAEKGVGDLIDAFSKIKTGFKLKIAGEGPLKEELKRKAKDKKNIEFLGWQNDKQLEKLIKEASLMVVPSLWYENAPYSVIEAMGAQKVVLCSSLGGLRELVQDGESGFIFDPHKKDDLENKLKYIIGHKHEFEKIGKRAKKLIKDKNDKNKYLKSLNKMYNSLKNG